MASLHLLLFAPTEKNRSHYRLWFIASLVVAAIYPLLAMQEAFSQDYIVQDDARQHVFWMSRFVDAELFPGDLIADYFQSVAPWGYTAFYRLFAGGIEPLVLHKLLPLGLALICTGYTFGIALEFLPIPFAGFLTTLLLNHSLWMRDDIISGTPVAFVYAIFPAFLYYLLRRSVLPCLGTIGLQGLFYPQCVFVFCGILVLRLIVWQQGSWRWSPHRRDYVLTLAGLGTAVLVMLPYALRSSPYDPIITATDAKALFTLSSEGWSAFFTDNPLDFWFCGKRSGMFPREWCVVNYGLLPAESFQPSPLRALLLPHIWLTLLLPFAIKSPLRFPLAQRVTSQIWLLPQLVLASLSLFFVAHALLFKLHLPNRYTEHSLRLGVALAAGVALTLGLEAIIRHLYARSHSQPEPAQPRMSVGARVGIGLLAISLLLYPYLLRFEDTPFPVIQYSTGRFPALYQFLAEQPKDSLIASLDREVNGIPSFTKRSILIGTRGYILPYHTQYYQQMNQRVIDLIAAQYSPDLAQVQQFIQRYGVDFWLLDEASFRSQYLKSDSVFEEYRDVVRKIRPQLRRTPPALQQISEQCTVLQERNLRLVDATCILQQS